MVKKIIVSAVFLLLSSAIQGQFINYGSDPSRFKWSIVKLSHHDLIYPQGNDSMAYRYALYLENAYSHVEKSIGKPMKKRFPVVLHPSNMNSNGMVAWAPRRMELITTPPSDLGMQRWDKHLVLHELRHQFQTGRVMRGVFTPLYYVLGEQAAGIASFLLPIWFLEGDAVSTETALSNGGRGRLPEFNMIYRAQRMGTNRFHSFDKWLLGSYKDYTGSYYALGYNMVSYARQRYGMDIWKKNTSRYSRNLLFPASFKHFTGSSFSRLFEDTFDYLKKEWAQTDTVLQHPTYLSPDTKYYTTYRSPHQVNDSTIIAHKWSLQEINSLVQVTSGKEHHLSYIGQINSRLRFCNNAVYWTEITPGIRWRHENYSELKRYDLSTGKLTTLTSGQRYLAVDVLRNSNLAAVSRPQIDGTNELVVIESTDGKELVSYQVPYNDFIKEITFVNEDTIIVAAVGEVGINLLELDRQNKTWRTLLKTSSINISSLVWHQDRLYFESGANGINNIYALNPTDSLTYRVTNAHFGAFDPSFNPHNNHLIFSDYQPEGYRIAVLAADSMLHEQMDLSKPIATPFVEELSRQEGYNIDRDSLSTISFVPKRYGKARHLFKIHSWMPFYYSVADALRMGTENLTTLVKPGAMILSQNSLNTAILQAGWYYNRGYHHGKLAFTYQGWFPVIDLSIDYGGKAFDMTWISNNSQEILQGVYNNRDLVESQVRIYLPINRTKNDRIRGIQPSITYYLTNNKYQQIQSRQFSNFQYILYEMNIYNYRRMAPRDLLPRLGYQLRLQHLNSPFNSENYGRLYASRLTTYWPGLFSNHSLMVRTGYQYQMLNGKPLYLPNQLFETPRGYNYLYQTRQQWTIKGDYAFSLFSPDLKLGSLAYLKRLRTNIFYEITQNQNNTDRKWSKQSSTGIDLLLDWNAFRLTYPLTTGVRLTQPIDYGSFQTDLLFSISF